MSKVYHDKLFPSIEEQDRKFPDDFMEVAECSTDDLGEIFEITNHIEQAWWLNEGVRKTIEGQARSTSVGDVIVLSDGTAYVVRPVGWSVVGSVNNGPLPLSFKSGYAQIGDADGK